MSNNFGEVLLFLKFPQCSRLPYSTNQGQYTIVGSQTVLILHIVALLAKNDFSPDITS